MSNKYQEALNFIFGYALDGSLNDNESNLVRDKVKILQELVDKATPKKPIGTYTDFKCPVCSRRVRSGKGSSSRQRDNVCQRCFQVLDWSVNND